MDVDEWFAAAGDRAGERLQRLSVVRWRRLESDGQSVMLTG